MAATEETALLEGRAWADLSDWRKSFVSGSDARAWLQDLITAEIDDLEPGFARRSLLLSPTGRIRADFTVAVLPSGLLLVQDPRQPHPIERLLAPYVLSSDVHLRDRTEDLGLLAFPNAEPPSDSRTFAYRPSTLGTGFDALVEQPEDRERLTVGGQPVSRERLEARRIERGEARFPVDLTESSLPHEAGLDHAIAYGKGCFLGQEAVARVRNLGHPPRVVLALRADSPVAAGDPIVSNDRAVGEITSVADPGTAAIGRVSWAARDAELATRAGVELDVLDLASGTPGAS